MFLFLFCVKCDREIKFVEFSDGSTDDTSSVESFNNFVINNSTTNFRGADDRPKRKRRSRTEFAERRRRLKKKHEQKMFLEGKKFLFAVFSCLYRTRWRQRNDRRLFLWFFFDKFNSFGIQRLFIVFSFTFEIGKFGAGRGFSIEFDWRKIAKIFLLASSSDVEQQRHGKSSTFWRHSNSSQSN